VHRYFTIDADEPFELLGRNTALNPQELLLSALSACLTVGYVTAAAREGIVLEKLEIETTATLDLRGFFCIEPAVPVGYDLTEDGHEGHRTPSDEPDAGGAVRARARTVRRSR
jgi:OsmC-like protein